MRALSLVLVALCAGACSRGSSGAGEAAPAPPVASSATTPSAGIAPSATGSASAPSSPAPASASASAPSSAAPAGGAPAACPDGTKLVTGGIFAMGSDGVNDEESPRHRVALRPFCMDTYEVTVKRYAACVDKGACTPAHPDKTWCNASQKGKDDHPVNCVDWKQAGELCAFEGKRLPTEREWEYAARGGAEQRPYAWGAEPPDGRSCYSHPGTCVVGSYPAGAFGLHDVTGNVWEWTASWFGKYPEEAETGLVKVYRGGSFSRRFPKWMRNGLRNRYRPDEWGAHLGMRCAMDLAGAACPDGSSAREDGKGCRVDGDPIPKPAPVTAGAGGGPVKAAASDPSVPPKETKEKVDPSTQPVTVSRDPTFDADCQRWKPGRPVSYMVRGGQFAERQAKKGACVNRDVGVGFNSVCCAQ